MAIALPVSTGCWSSRSLHSDMQRSCIGAWLVEAVSKLSRAVRTVAQDSAPSLSGKFCLPGSLWGGETPSGFTSRGSGFQEEGSTRGTD